MAPYSARSLSVLDFSQLSTLTVPTDNVTTITPTTQTTNDIIFTEDYKRAWLELLVIGVIVGLVIVSWFLEMFDTCPADWRRFRSESRDRGWLKTFVSVNKPRSECLLSRNIVCWLCCCFCIRRQADPAEARQQREQANENNSSDRTDEDPFLMELHNTNWNPVDDNDI